MSCEKLLIVVNNHSAWPDHNQISIMFLFLAKISPDRKKLQEAMFEVITSEASYLKSLNVLIRHFVQSPKFAGTIPGDTSHTGAVITKRDFRVLFSDIIAVCISFICTTIFHTIRFFITL